MKVTNQSERNDKAKKVIGVAAGATAAALMFNKTGLRKFADEAARAFKNANRDIGAEMAKKSIRELDYKTLKGMYKKNIQSKDSGFQKAFNQNNKISISSKTGLAKMLKERDAFDANRMSFAKKVQDSHIRSNVLKAAQDRIKPEGANQVRKVNQAVMAALDNHNKYMLKMDGEDSVWRMSPAFKKMLKGTSIEDKADDLADVIERSYTDLRNSSDVKEISGKFIGKTFPKISKEIDDKIIESADRDEFFKKTIEKASAVKDIIDKKGKEASKDITVQDILRSKKTMKEEAEKAVERAATVKDLLDAKASGKVEFDNEANDLIDSIISFKNRNKDADIDNMIVSKELRIFNGKLYSGKSFEESMDSFKEGFADTIPGKLFGVRSFLDKGKAPGIHLFEKGTFDANLAALTGSSSDLIESNYMYVMGNMYKIGNGGAVQKQSGIDNLELMSGIHGVFNVLNDRIHGNFQYRENENKLFDILSINTTGNNALEKFKSRFTKFSNEDKKWKRRELNDFVDGKILDDFDYTELYDIENIIENYSAGKDINRLLESTLRTPTVKEATQLKEVFKNKESLNILQAFFEDNPIEYLRKGEYDIRGNLKNIVSRQKKDPDYVKNLVKIGNLNGMNGLNVLHGDDIVKREIIKSAMHAESVTNTIGNNSVTLEKIKGANLSESSKDYLKRVLFWSDLETLGRYDVSTQTSELTEGQLLTLSRGVSKMTGNIDSSVGQNKNYINEFQNEIRRLVRENTSLLEEGEISHPEAINGYKNNRWSAIQKTKTLSALDIISDINNYTKNESAKLSDTKTADFLRQFVAGRNNPEDITTGTLLPYHMLNRLVTPMEKFGIGFDPRQTGSVGALASNIMLKRVIPIGLGVTALSYLNFEAEKTTGTSFTEAYENAKANSTLGIKRMQGAIGLDDGIDRNRKNNPISDYLFGQYKDEEEYLDYLEYGSDPVRKGRFWSFGSTSEFKGGKIAYWEPNSLRQAHSNYKDIALYGSSEEKWSRSLMPSLRYPLSPLKYLMNPYWVEDKNYYDRPYPVSGKMFAEGTPWGAILNPTIGEIIKPQKTMHREDMLGLNDSRSIISKINSAIKNNAAEGSAARLDEGGVTPIGLSPKGMPSLDGAIMSYALGEGSLSVKGIRGADFAESLPSFNYAISPMSESEGDGAVYRSMASSSISDNSILNATINTMNRTGYNYGNRIDPNMIISQINNDIKNSGNVDDIITTERARMNSVPYKESSEVDKMRYLKSLNLNAQGDALLNIGSSAKELSGMYGFLFEQIMPGKRGYKLAEAGSMTSFSRGFWDENIGGMGGDFMEIARRFFPHENHDIQSVNPLRNTQPMWLPERFWTGDPYTALPKGEARLPGRGYEALNKLNSDKYGRYGAFDRFKILADIAPSSEEYKIWKKIAEEEISDPRLKKQMKMIKGQAEEQIKEHDFYNYRFLNKDMENKTAVIETVNTDGTFTVVGENQTYALAGLNINKNESTVQEYLKGGMKVTLKYEDNDYNKYRNVNSWEKHKPPVVAAIVDHGGENIGAKMYYDGAADEIDASKKTTLADNIFTASQQDINMGHVWEAIGHARIPYFHNKFLRINSPMETYKHEQVYGTAYATWDHPVKGFIEPAFREAWSKGPVAQAVGVGTWALSEWVRTTDLDDGIKKAAHGAFALTNPAAFAGGVMGALPRMSVGSTNGIVNSKNGARIGALVGIGGYAISNLENPFMSALNFGVLGAAAMNQLKPEVGKGAVREVLDTKYGAVAGALIGIGLSGLKNPDFKLSNIKETYIPQDTKDKWDIEEYFDRLNYIKYDALYRKAARLAKDKEGVDIESIFNAYEWNRDKNKEKRIKLEEKKNLLAKMYTDPGERTKFIQSMDLEIEKLEMPEQYFGMDKYTKSAVAFKKARDTTIYGLTEFSNSADILRALPKYDRDFFMEFANEKDPEERKEILRYVSPFKAKALKAMWGEEVENNESNAEYFGNHNLPGLFWAGWKPDVDMEQVKMKTIENEGMLLSDFGLYDSAKNEPSYNDAPEIYKYKGQGNSLAVQASIQGMLGGIGLTGVNVSVESRASEGIDVIANIAQAGMQRASSVTDKFINMFI